MATREVDEPGQPDEPVIFVYGRKVLEAAGTDARLTWRALLGLALTAACVAVSPTPFNVIGAVGVVLTALEVARLAWRK
jgi:hypothetical protein